MVCVRPGTRTGRAARVATMREIWGWRRRWLYLNNANSYSATCGLYNSEPTPGRCCLTVGTLQLLSGMIVQLRRVLQVNSAEPTLLGPIPDLPIWKRTDRSKRSLSRLKLAKNARAGHRHTTGIERKYYYVTGKNNDGKKGQWIRSGSKRRNTIYIFLTQMFIYFIYLFIMCINHHDRRVMWQWCDCEKYTYN